MGWFDFLTKKGPSSDAIAKQVQKAKEPYAQPDYRRVAMDQLLKWDTDESLRGILDRFCVVVQSPHWDEEEKHWLVEEMVTRGDKVMPILQRFILERNEVNYALLAIKRIAKDQKIYRDLLILALNHRPPSDHRSVQGKQEIIAAMMELNDPSLEPLILPHLEDHSDDVQCLAISALAQSHSSEVKARLIDIIKNEDHSARVMRTAASVIAAQKFELPEGFQIAPILTEDYKVENGLLLHI
jgi:hypothetical protein